MSYEYYLEFSDTKWLDSHEKSVSEFIMRLPTYCERDESGYWLRGPEEPESPGRAHDVRIVLPATPPSYLRTRGAVLGCLEVYGSPVSIKRDLCALLSFIRQNSNVSVIDDDGEECAWGKP